MMMMTTAFYFCYFIVRAGVIRSLTVMNLCLFKGVHSYFNMVIPYIVYRLYSILNQISSY
jgi:hypothetical protein